MNEAGRGESPGPGSNRKFVVMGADPDGRTIAFYAKDWADFDQQFRAAFGRRRTPQDKIDVEDLPDDGAD